MPADGDEREVPVSQPKLGDVAKLAGVSPTTVSRVLNNRGYLSEATRKKVHAAMHELGYRPNAIARTLKGQRSQTIGLIFPTVANPFYAELVYRLESLLADAGYRVILCNSEDHPELEERYLDMLLANQVDGIITGAHSQAVAQFTHLRAPLVTVDRADTGRYPTVRSDNYAGARMATEHLLATGARRILHITSTAGAQNLRLSGYTDAMVHAGCTPRVLETGFRTAPERKRALIEEYLGEHLGGAGAVQAVFASNDTYAAMALHWAHTALVRVPDEFQVIGFDGTESVRTLMPHLATVVQPVGQIAARAVRRVLQAIDGEQQSAPSVDVLPVRLQVGATARAL